MLWRCRPSSTLHTSRFVHSWWRPTWPKHPAICCYWLIDSARSMPSSMLIKICSPIVQCKDAISVHEHTTEVHKGLVVGRDDCETSHTRPPYYWCGMWVNVCTRAILIGAWRCVHLRWCTGMLTDTYIHTHAHVFILVCIPFCKCECLLLLIMHVHAHTTMAVVVCAYFHHLEYNNSHTLKLWRNRVVTTTVCTHLRKQVTRGSWTQ